MWTSLNESVDLLVKGASYNGEYWKNDVTYKEITSSLKSIYENMDSRFFFSESKMVGSYFLKNFSNISIKTVRRSTKEKLNCEILSRMITGYSKTRSFLFKAQLIDSPNCECGYPVQNLNHIFWACPILAFERERLLSLLRNLNLLDPFSIEYLFGNFNKKIAAILLKFAKVANSKLNISI